MLNHDSTIRDYDTSTLILLDEKARKNRFFTCDPIPAQLDGKASLICPLDLDSEFKNIPLTEALYVHRLTGSQGVTVQMRGYFHRQALTFTHPNQVRYLARMNRPLRFPEFTSGIAWIDYLQYHGFNVILERCENNKITSQLPLLQFILYFHYSASDIYQSLLGPYREDFDQLLLAGYIMSGKRIRSGEALPYGSKDSVPTPWVATVNGFPYRIAICLFDSAAVQGRVSLATAAENVDLPMPYKELMKEWITRMHDAYTLNPENYQKYAEADCVVSEMLESFKRHMRDIWQALGIVDYFIPPRMSLGATVRDIAECIIHKASRDTDYQKDKEFFQAYCEYSSANYLRKLTTESAIVLSKTDGGRCFSNNPTLGNFQGEGIDLDIKGCYAQGLRNQPYPIGRPMILSYPESKQNKYHTLREFLDVVGYGTEQSELIPYLWFARVSTPDNVTLKFPQDLIPSWIGFKTTDMSQYRFDSEIESFDDPDMALNLEIGESKVFTQQIKHGVITHDILQWIETICSTWQRKELLDTLYVEAAMFYPASQQVHSLDELKIRLANHDAHNEVLLRFEHLPTITRIERECYAWYANSLGDLLVDRLMAERMSHPSKTPLNTLFKLTINTLYGDIVSPHFALGNVCVSNNVTAKARVACWATEKATHGIQAITDGCPLDLNRIVHKRNDQRVTASEYYRLYAIKKPSEMRQLKLAPLGNYYHHELTVRDSQLTLTSYHTASDNNPRILQGDAIKEWICQAILDHVHSHFPKLDIFHTKFTTVKGFADDSKQEIILREFEGIYDYEIKTFFTEAAFHGSANQMLLNPLKPDEPDIRMRSYERTEYQAVIMVDGQLILFDTYKGVNPALHFLQAIIDNEHAIARAPAFYKSRLIQVGEYQHKKGSTFKHSELKPGDEIKVVGLLREFSLSQHRFQNEQQYLAIKREYLNSKNRYSQYVEAFFCNADGTVDLTRMNMKIDELLNEGCLSLVKALDPHNHCHRKNSRFRYHPAHETLRKLKEEFARIQGFIDEQDTLLSYDDKERDIPLRNVLE